MRNGANPRSQPSHAAAIVQARYAQYAAEQAELQTATPVVPPHEEPEPTQLRKVEHSLLCATQFSRVALCDCKKDKTK